VVEGLGSSLFGRNWLDAIKMDGRSIKQMLKPVDHLLSKYQQLFQEGLGTLKDVRADLTVKPGA